MNALHVVGRADYGSVVINDTEVKLETFAVTQGDIQYRAVVDVEFSYDD